MSIDLSRETYDRAVPLADGFWIIATRHHPGFMEKRMPEVNNRCCVFRLHEPDRGPVLLVANGVDPVVIPEVRRLEQETGLAVRHVLSVGGGHHLRLPEWRDAFPGAVVHVGPERIPRTPSARKLMDGGRVVVMDRERPLSQFAGQLEAVLFTGIRGMRDERSVFEGGKEPGMLKFMQAMARMDDPTDELWLYHPPTRTVLGGENLGWILSAESVKRFPMPLRLMFKANTVYVQDKARKVADRDAVARAWRRVLAWKGETLLGYHEPPGDAFQGDVAQVLESAARKVKQLGG